MQAKHMHFEEMGGAGLISLMAERWGAIPVPVRTSGARTENASNDVPPAGEPSSSPPFRAALSADERRAMVRCGLWLRGAFVAASLVAIGIADLVAGDGHPGWSLLLVAASVPLTVIAWRRARAAIGRADALTAKAVAPKVATDTAGGS